MDGTFGFPKGESASKEVIEAIRKEQILQKPTIPPGKTAPTAPTAQKPTVTPGKRVPNPDISIIDYLDSKGEKSDPASRKKIAERFGMSNYKGSATQNLELIRLLKEEPKILAARAADAGVDFNYIPEEKVRKETLVEVKKPTLIITEKPTLVKKKKLGLFSKKK